MDHTTYFYVWRKGGNVPSKEHYSYESAQAEAERLAHLQPGDEFYVLQVMGVAKLPKPPSVYREFDEVPF